ncbi:MAG: hypothetical protein AAF772_10905, partial [Acidobacteriota bacterium]
AVVEAIDRGDLRTALGFYARALELARADADGERLDRAICNHSAVRISLGDHVAPRPLLRDVLTRNRSRAACFLAADNLSRAYEYAKTFKKGLFYARVARSHARALGRPEWLASTYNQSGNCLLGLSYFAEAADEYAHALALFPADSTSPVRTALEANVGYCAMMRGEVRRGLALSLRSLRRFRRLGNRQQQAAIHLDCCYGYLECGQLTRARRHGSRALALAEAIWDGERVKNALFLLGETARAAGDQDAAVRRFDRLQKTFYPDQPHLTDLLVHLEMRQVVNLRA